MSIATILQGLVIGLAIAAPVGPIGMLCIRRTLHHGVGTGLATGLGAALADAMYGLVAAGGLGVAGWLVGHSRMLSLGGAALLAWMGFESLRAWWRKARAQDTRADDPAVLDASAPVAFASTFALTASNPMTIVSFVGVIAALGAPGAGPTGAPWLLVLGVFAGSTLWWTFLVSLVRIVRRAISPGALRAIDLVTAAILLGTAAWVAARAVG